MRWGGGARKNGKKTALDTQRAKDSEKIFQKSSHISSDEKRKNENSVRDDVLCEKWKRLFSAALTGFNSINKSLDSKGRCIMNYAMEKVPYAFYRHSNFISFHFMLSEPLVRLLIIKWNITIMTRKPKKNWSKNTHVASFAAWCHLFSLIEMLPFFLSSFVFFLVIWLNFRLSSAVQWCCIHCLCWRFAFASVQYETFQRQKSLSHWRMDLRHQKYKDNN